MNPNSHSEDFQKINQALDLLEIERLSYGFWKIYAQFLLTRVDPDVARHIGEKVCEAIKEANKEMDAKKQAYVQEALHDFIQEVRAATS